MSERVGVVFYEVQAETGNAIRGLRRTQVEADRTGGAFDKLQGRVTAVAAAVTAALGAIAVEGLVSKLIGAQRQFDVMFASLKTMTGGTELASQAWGRLQKFAAQTPYTLQQAVDGFVKLKALGLDPSERAMTSFGNTASAMGKSLTQMIEAVADASTGEFERLKEFGIKAHAEGDKVALTFRGVTTTIRNSASAITEYLVKIGEVQFAGAMSERMKTLDGDISNLQDSLAALYLTISQSGFGEAIAKGVRAATQAIQEASTSIKEGALTEYFDKLRPYVTAAELAVVALSGAIAGRLVASFIAAATQAYAAAAAMGVATLAARGFTAVLVALGGPIGIAITGLALLALNWEKVGGQARDAATMSEQAAERIAAALKRAPDRASKDLAAQLSEVKDEIAGIDKELGRTSFPLASDADLAELRQRRDTLVKIAGEVQAALRKATGGDEWGGEGKRTAPAAAPPPPPSAKSKFDAVAYLAKLREATAEEFEKISLVEQEALRQNARQEGLSEQQRAEAVLLIRAKAGQDRIELAKKIEDRIEQDVKARAAKRESDEAELARGRAMAQDVIVADDPVARLEVELQRKLALNAQYAALDVENEKLYAEARVALRRDAEAQINEIRNRSREQEQAYQAASIAMVAAAAGQLYAIYEQSGKDRTALGKALFLVSKALAVAEILINTEVAASKAGAQLGIYGIPMATLIRATGYASAGLVSGMAVAQLGGGRQYGGPTDAGGLYRVNETGRPEMFTASNGSQYMLASQRGNVTPADKVGGGALNVSFNVVNQHPTAVVSQRQ